MTVLQELKKFMLEYNVSVVDLSWKTLKAHKINMAKLLKWELKQKKLNL